VARRSHLWGDAWSGWEAREAPLADHTFAHAPRGTLVFADYRTGKSTCIFKLPGMMPYRCNETVLYRKPPKELRVASPHLTLLFCLSFFLFWRALGLG
jgi:hypothetical protein